MIYPNLKEEKRLWRQGCRYVIGVDEVGRGAFAGPLVVGAVCLTQECVLPAGINDSKVLNKRLRGRLAKIIKKQCYAWSVGEVSVAKINRVGIGGATSMAVREAVRKIFLNLEEREARVHLLLDAFYIKYIRGLGLKGQKAIVKGDKKSLAIASASIVAKVYRDSLMKKLGRVFPAFGWGRNKGYGTRIHREAILRYGTTKWHRKDFVKTWLASL